MERALVVASRVPSRPRSTPTVAALPDIDPDKDVEITTEGGVARIHAHRHQRSETRDKEGYRSEFRYGEFDRGIALPPEDHIGGAGHPWVSDQLPQGRRTWSRIGS
jgi:hypothetical protein